MNKAAFTEDELRQAALQVHEAMMAALTPVNEHEFSFEFHRKMSTLLRKMKLHHGIKVAAKSVAAVFLALLIGGGALLTFNTDVRAAFFSWVREIYENSVFYQFVGDEQAEVLPYIRPAWMPEGYIEIANEGDDYKQTVVYQDDVGTPLYFSYRRIRDDKSIFFYSDGFTRFSVNVGKHEADLYIPDNPDETNELVWADEENKIICNISSYEKETVILDIAESVNLEE